MIFITVGGFPGGFNRLIQAVDEIAPFFEEKFFAQIGGSTYTPKNIEFVRHLDYQKTEDSIRNAKLVISHGGGGSITWAIKYHRPIIITPRRKMYKEHYTDHQTELCKVLLDQKRKNLYVVEDMSKLREVVKIALQPGTHGAEESNNGKQNIINTIRDFLKNGAQQ